MALEKVHAARGFCCVEGDIQPEWSSVLVRRVRRTVVMQWESECSQFDSRCRNDTRGRIIASRSWYLKTRLERTQQ